MNKRLEDLAEQANMLIVAGIDVWGNTVDAKVGLQKFAELIVRECALIAKTAEPYKSDDLILKRFGFDDERI